jgi:hypothetical protein
MLKAHAAAWLMLIGRPATVKVALRGDVDGFVATVTLTVPLPVPVIPLAMLIQSGPVVTLHGHTPAASTDSVAVPPVAANAFVGGETAYVHDGSVTSLRVVHAGTTARVPAASASRSNRAAAPNQVFMRRTQNARPIRTRQAAGCTSTSHFPGKGIVTTGASCGR